MPFSGVQSGVRRYKRVINALNVTQWIHSHSDIIAPLMYTYIRIYGTGNESKFSWVSQAQDLSTNMVVKHFEYFDQLAFRFVNSQRFYPQNGYCYPNSIRILKKMHSKRQYATMLGPVSDVPFCTEPYNEHNLVCAYLKRLTPKLPLAQPNDINLLGVFVSKWLKRNCTPLPYIPYSDELFESYILKLKHFNHLKKMNMRKSHLLIMTGFWRVLTPRKERKLYKIKSFVKREFYEEPKNLRFINSRSLDFRVLVGPYIKLIEEQLYKQNPYFVKGKIITELPKDIMRLKNYRYFLETDYSSFESSFSPAYTDNVECQMMRFYLKNNPEILNYVMKCYYTRKNGLLLPRNEYCSNFGHYVYRTVGTRMSGEMWTSLANSFSNLMNMLYICDKRQIKCDGFVEGDDGLFGLSENTIVEADYNNLGFKIKMHYTSDLSLTTFCGNMFSLQTLHSLVPLEQISRVFVTCSSGYLNVRNIKQSYLLRAKAMSLYVQGKHTPIAGPLSYYILRILGPGPILNDPGESWWNYYVMDMTQHKMFDYQPILMDDRIQYFRMTGISIEQQILIEEHFSKAKTIEQLYCPRPLMRTSFISGMC